MTAMLFTNDPSKIPDTLGAFNKETDMIRDRLNRAAEAVSGVANRAAAKVGEIATSAAEVAGDFSEAAHKEVKALKDLAKSDDTIWLVLDGFGKPMAASSSASKAEVLVGRANTVLQKFFDLPKEEKSAALDTVATDLLAIFPHVKDGTALVNNTLKSFIISDGEPPFTTEKLEIDV
jgi:hypothetical protein